MTLILDQVSKKFADVQAVQRINLKLPKGEIFGIVGANGAGKTTTFRMILGLIEPSEGKITWEGNQFKNVVSSKIGYLPEERGLYPKLKVKDQLIYLGRLRGMKRQEVVRQVRYWLDRFNVPEFYTKKPESLSKGNQQKIQFIAAVMHRPELLILDEPFSGLDPLNVALLKNAVVDLKNSGTSILFSSHRMEHVEELCEHISILHRGQQVVHGSLKEVKRDFGKLNVTVHADFSLHDFRDYEGVVHFMNTAEGAQFQIENEQTAQHLFQALAESGFVRKFTLEEPSLNDIFLEKVGADDE
ncbi:ATP-binding cassette domain-containing protein [Texcoconibacillus texcoconensis]|uniref:ABC-2 type transport system ATP-binding protein n=1 Tax=Texcoconibacillus texcoconensis TaxID=1095777 RepID=A0A840QPJ1_9BACI|nr:ABC-2 type transport system ATP-binding protein [Texcoconibacillus texcoconensis]